MAAFPTSKSTSAAGTSAGTSADTPDTPAAPKRRRRRKATAATATKTTKATTKKSSNGRRRGARAQKSVSAVAPAGARRGRPPTGITQKKQDFIRVKLGKDPKITRNAMSEFIKAKFGTMLAFPKIAEVYNELGIVSDGRRGRGARKTSVRRGSGVPRGTGRRTSDLVKSKVFDNIRVQPEFFVTIVQNGQMDVAPFTSESGANAFISAQVTEKGVPFPNIGFYARFPADINVSVTLGSRR